MRSAVLLFTLATLATFVLAAPTPANTLMKRSFTVPVVGRGKLSPAEAMAQAYRKYGWEIIVFDPEQPAPTASGYAWPNKTTTAVAGPTGTSSGNDGEGTATPEKHDQANNSPFTIGGQTLNLNFDTGSADLWVFSTEMPSNEDSGHTLFNPSQSSTWTTYTGGSWSILYGDDSNAQGNVGFDTVNIGGAIVQKQCIELATEASGSFLRDRASDGLVGLAFSSINQVQPEQQKTFFANIMHSLDQPIFTVDLSESSGIYEFGSIDSTKYTGDIHYAPVDSSQGYWQIQSEAYTLGGKQIACTICSPTVADTGTSLLLLDEDIVAAYYKQVQGAQFSYSKGGYVFPCSASLPELGIAIGDYMATITDTVYGRVSEDLCFGGIQRNTGDGMNILGDVFLKQVFAVFDGGNLRLGIAEKP